MSVNILDAFLITFGLEPKGFEEGERKVREGSKRLREESKKTFDGMEREGKQVGAALKSVRNEVIGLGLAFMGARSITDLITGMATGAATADRLGKTMGMTTKQVWAWRQAMRDVGGKDGDADAALQSIQRMRMGIQQGQFEPAQMGILGRLGIHDIQNVTPGEILRKMSAASERMDPQLFSDLLGQLGLSGPVTYFLMKGQTTVDRLLSEYEENADQMDELAKETEKLQHEMTKLTGEIKEALVPALIKLVPVLTDLVKVAGQILDAIPWADRDTPVVGGQSHPPGYLDDVRRRMGFGPMSTPGAPMSFPQGGMSLPNSGKATGGSNEATIYNFFRAKGISHGQTLGIMAALHAESNLNERAVNPSSGAYGINQWLSKDRRANFKKRFGHDITKSTLQEQLDFLWWELKGGDHGGDDVLAEKSSKGAAWAMIKKFLRPGAGAETRGDWQRAQRYIARGGNGGIYIQNMTVQAKDAKSFSTDLQAKTRRYSVAKADQGVAP